jgi:hypothetical protein
MFVRPKTLGLGSQPSSLHLDLTISQVQDNVGVTNMSDPSALDVAECQAQVPWD